jgi:hypothetical protein
LHSFNIKRWESRQAESEAHRVKSLRKIKSKIASDLFESTNIPRTKIQEELINKVSANLGTFEERMVKDMNEKESRLSELEKALEGEQQCSFAPKLNIKEEMLKNRDENALYGLGKKKEMEEKEEKKKKGKGGLVFNNNKKKKKISISGGGFKNKEQQQEKLKTKTKTKTKSTSLKSSAEEKENILRSKFEKLLD